MSADLLPSELTLAARLDRAHRMCVSDPSRHTLYSEARDEIARLTNLLQDLAGNAHAAYSDDSRERAIQALVSMGHPRSELIAQPTWRLIIMKNTDATLFDME